MSERVRERRVNEHNVQIIHPTASEAYEILLFLCVHNSIGRVKLINVCLSNLTGVVRGLLLVGDHRLSNIQLGRVA